MRWQLARARDYFEKAERGVRKLDKQSRWPVRTPPRSAPVSGHLRKSGAKQRHLIFGGKGLGSHLRLSFGALSEVGSKQPHLRLGGKHLDMHLSYGLQLEVGAEHSIYCEVGKTAPGFSYVFGSPILQLVLRYVKSESKAFAGARFYGVLDVCVDFPFESARNLHSRDSAEGILTTVVILWGCLDSMLSKKCSCLMFFVQCWYFGRSMHPWCCTGRFSTRSRRMILTTSTSALMCPSTRSSSPFRRLL
jgi:hypothetical protein